ncbi:MAG: HlyC/CorC family transporter [Deltaproteobacteria bacterium]|nr:HlyC/CorC family transporter [Deltaproteobacteria bacterium]MBT4527802.1 HlyC/CorC family transporter [Deltaproteobacteria bacterium]
MILSFTILLILIVLSGFFSGIETAFISLSEIDLIEIEKSNRKNRRILLHLLDNKEKLLSTILTCNNIVNISASALNTILAPMYAPILGISEGLSIILSAGVLTIVILLFSEITPKSIALYHNVELSLVFAPVISVISVLFSPITYFFDKFSKILNQIFTTKNSKKHNLSEKTIINVVSRGEELGVINENEKNLIQNVFLFDEREVYPIMTPRTSVFALMDSMRLSEVKNELLEKQYSRVPIYNDTIDNITGIINLKTVYSHILNHKQDSRLIDLAQDPIFIYETLKISALLEQFRLKHNHMAIVMDEFGGMAGLVTLEDVLEELVGEIYDEKDEIDISIRQIEPEKWLINGNIDIITINKKIKGEIPPEGGFEVLQGLIMSNLERIPLIGDSLFIDPHRYEVVSMKKNEVTSVIIEYQPHKSNK